MSAYSYSGYSYCAAPCCQNNAKNNSEISYFRFPKDPQRCLSWIANSGSTKLKAYSAEHCYQHYRLCSFHFENSMFSSLLKNRLKKSAIPTLFNNINLDGPPLEEVSILVEVQNIDNQPQTCMAQESASCSYGDFSETSRTMSDEDVSNGSATGILNDFKSEPESPQLLVEERDPLCSTNEPPIPRKKPRPETVVTRLSSTSEDVFDAIGKNVAHKLRGMTQQQRIIAEKIISDVMYHGQMETLTVDSHLSLNKNSS